MSKTVVITGAGGFVGGHLVEFFTRHGWDVVAVFHKEPGEHDTHTQKRQIQKDELLARIPAKNREHLTIFDGDITNQSDMRQLFRENHPDALIHAAALLVPPKEADYQDHAAFSHANERFIEVNQAKILADCAAEYQREENEDLYSLLVSTIHVFNPKAPVINETLQHEPINIYAQSKDEAQQYWESETLNLNLGVIYPPQVFGANQFTPAIIARLIRKIILDEGPLLTISGAINPIHVNNLIKL